MCPDCDSKNLIEREQQRQRDETAAAAGYERGWTSTPEYHRIQRERLAAQQGRSIPDYTPQAERERIAIMVAADEHAYMLRSRWAREWLRPFRGFRSLYQNDIAFREGEKARWRETYANQRQDEVARVAVYKRAHAGRNLEWTAARKDRESMLGDGSITPDIIARMKAAATHCAYCGCVLTGKQADHMIPLVLGGEHSIRNIIIVCPQCNGRKARLSYEEWIERVEPEHRQRVMAVYRERYGEARQHEQSCCQTETFGPPFANNSGAFRDLTSKVVSDVF